ncbi:MAG: efflux RND transporter permease subunit [Phycisphaerae bacterium]|nr:efflux RND transporter permease subunit [Phycisphaerae bacterium]
MTTRRGPSIVDWFIENPVKVAVGVILAVMFGLLTVTPPSLLPSPIRLPVQLTPNLDQPIVSVSTTWQGASPEEVEREIIEPQEEQLKGLQNLTKMTGKASEGYAEITLEFTVDADQDVARQDTSDALRRVKYQIPQNEFDNPVIVAGSARGGGEIAWLILRGEQGVDVTKMYDFVDEQVKPLLERVDGISAIKIYGGLEREIQVVVDAPRMAAARITFRELEAALQGQNVNVSAGTSPQGKRDVVMRTMGQYESIDEIGKTVIRVGPGGPIRVDDVATVIDTYKKPAGFVRSMGDYVLALPAYRKTGSNVIEVMEGLRAAIDRVNKEVLRPRAMSLLLTQVYDETVYINSAIDLVRDNIYVGGLLTILVLLAFLRSGSATLVVAVSIPISVIATFLVMPLFGRSINVVMLAGLAFAVGMVVDNAIVVLENIYRHREMGKDRWKAASDGAREVWGAVLANSLTTMIVFLPIVFVAEEAGQLFRDIALAISASVALSLAVAIAVVPTMATRLLKPGREDADKESDAKSALTSDCDDNGDNGDVPAIAFVRPGTNGQPTRRASAEPSRIRRGIAAAWERVHTVLDPYVLQPSDRLGGWFVGKVVAINERLQRGLAFRLVVAAGFIAASLIFAWLLFPKVEYLPNGNRNLVFGMLFTPPGYGVHEFRNMGFKVENGNPGAPNPADRAPGLRRFWEANEGTPEERAAKLAALREDWRVFVEARQIPAMEAQIAALEDSNGPESLSGKRAALRRAQEELASARDEHESRRFQSQINQLKAEIRALPGRVAELQRELKAWRMPPPAMENFFFVSFSGMAFMGCTSAEYDRVAPLARVMAAHAQLLPDTFSFFEQPSIFGRGLGTGNSVDVEIRGDRLEHVVHAAQMLQLAAMAEFSGYPQADPANFDKGRLEARLIPDRVRAGEVGLTTADVGFVVRACGDGAIVGQYRDAGKSYDLTLRVAGTRDQVGGRSETRAIADVQVASPAGPIVPLSALCRVEEVLAPQQINHIETQRAVQLTVRPPPGKPLTEVMERIEEIADEMRGGGYLMPAAFGGFPARLDPGVIVRLSGNASKLRMTWDSLKWLLLLSGIVVYLLMAGLFESFVYPFVIMTTVPLAAVGGFVGLALVHTYTWYNVNAALQELDVLAILGFVILLGVVVNNGILIVHQALNFAREGQAPQAAIAESVRTRLRPILMTTFTTLFGLLPLVLRPGAGAEIYRGLGAVVLGGLLCATVFTLLVVPSMLSLFVSGREYLVHWRRRVPADAGGAGAATGPIEEVIVAPRTRMDLASRDEGVPVRGSR